MSTAPPAPQASAVAARCVGLVKRYGKGDTAVMALAGVDVELRRGQFTAIMGPSGSGKSTLMHCMAGLDAATSGQVFVGEIELNRLDDKRLTRLRRDKIGFVFQAYNLVPTLTALENIRLPADIAGRPLDPRWLDAVIDTLGLRDRLRHRPSELSGGQQQRVACARALAGRPEIVFADEPTGNLDSRSSAEVLAFLRDSSRRTGQTIAMVTHDPSAAGYADRVLFLADGRIVDEMLEPTADRVLERMKLFDSPTSGVPAPGAPQGMVAILEPAPVPSPGEPPLDAAHMGEPRPAEPQPAEPPAAEVPHAVEPAGGPAVAAAAAPVSAAPAVLDGPEPAPAAEELPAPTQASAEELAATEAYLKKKYPDLFPAEDDDAATLHASGSNGHHPGGGDPAAMPPYKPEA
jgi:ABC-type lipoprotein export system ATPase subunit